MIPHRSIVERLEAVAGDAVVDVREKEAAGLTAGVWFVREKAADYASAEDPQEALSRAVGAHLVNAAAWLDSRSTRVFDEMRGEGLTLDVFVAAWISSDQIDLSLPPEFLLACGRLGLEVSLCTND